MTTFQAIILGIVQGISESLPISSSGHLILVPELLHWNVQDQAFDVMTHIGTLCAVIVYFRKKLYTMFRSLYIKKDNDANRRLLFFIGISILPAAVVGLFFNDMLTTWFRSATVVAYNLIFWGVVLYVADRYSKTRVNNPRSLSQLTVKHSLIIGCAQALALIPGTSRSGITMTAGLFQKFSKVAAVEFSFLMSIPITALAGISAIHEFFTGGVRDITVSAMVGGGIAAFVSGLCAMWFLFAVIKRVSFTPFVLYRIVLGILILVVL